MKAILPTLVAMLVLGPVPLRAGDKVDFNYDIRPIISAKGIAKIFSGSGSVLVIGVCTPPVGTPRRLGSGAVAGTYDLKKTVSCRASKFHLSSRSPR